MVLLWFPFRLYPASQNVLTIAENRYPPDLRDGGISLMFEAAYYSEIIRAGIPKYFLRASPAPRWRWDDPLAVDEVLTFCRRRFRAMVPLLLRRASCYFRTPL